MLELGSYFSRTTLGRVTKEGDSPVNEKIKALNFYSPKYHGAREIPWESAQTIG